MRLRILLLAAAALGLAACRGDRAARTGCNANSDALDAALCPTFEAAGYEPIAASDTELCTRLSVDMVGLRPSAAWIQDRCAGRSPYDVVVSLQHTKEYRETQRRRWADRFQYNDSMVDVKSIHDLDELVDRLYSEEMSYPEFAEVALAHPGFVGRFIGYGQPDAVADAAFRAFLGRPATAPERLDVGNLWRPWSNQNVVVEDGGPPPNAAASRAGADACPSDGGPSCGYYGYGPVPQIDPLACEAGVHSCRSELLGSASVDFPAGSRTTPLAPDQLTVADWVALRTPGRLFTRQPMFWEAQVDEVLKRYLGYDLGQRRPEARLALIHWFQSTNGDLVRLERAVLVSWAYRQTAMDLPGRPRPESLMHDPIAYGPTKLMIPETWLASMGQVTGVPAGNCDWRYPNLPEWYTPGYDTKLDALLSDVRFPKLADGRPDPAFRNRAASMGGCPGVIDYGSFTATTRNTNMGLLTAVAQEEAVVERCFLDAAPALVPEGLSPAATGRDATIRVVEHAFRNTLGASPSSEDLAQTVFEVEADCPQCTAETMARDLCAGLSGGVEFIFY